MLPDPEKEKRHKRHASRKRAALKTGWFLNENANGAEVGQSLQRLAENTSSRREPRLTLDTREHEMDGKA